MPPKKKDEGEEKRVVLGRLSHSLSAGIVGLPNVGKSTFFNVLTRSAIPAENFPFCTIDPSTARVAVPDDRFDYLVDHWKPSSVVPAYLEVTDIAGLIRGASSGEGLGNAFLSNIQATDGIMHVCRAFDDDEIIHVDNSIDPVRDLETIHEELLLKDIEFVERRVEILKHAVEKGIDKTKKADLEIAESILEFLVKDRKPIRMGHWKNVEIEFLNNLQLLTAKPAVYLVNMSEKDYLRQKNKYLKKVMDWVKEHTGEPVIPFSAEFEKKILDLPEDEAKAYMDENKTMSILPKVVRTVYHVLNLAHYFTAGHDEVKAWTIRAGTRAPQAAGRIHTDFEKGFICAEVVPFEAFKEHGSEGAAKAAGQYKQQGKNYEVQDGDIILFRFNVSNSKKK